MNQNNELLHKENLSDSKKNKTLLFESIAIAHITVTIILIFYIIMPILNSFNIKDTGLDLFNQQYGINFYKTIIITFFINYVYLKMAELFPGKIPVIYKRIMVIILFSVLLNYYINNTPFETENIKFMKTWLKTIGWFGLIWDLIHINIVGLLADKINTYNFNLNQMNLRNIFIFFIFTLSLLHI